VQECEDDTVSLAELNEIPNDMGKAYKEIVARRQEREEATRRSCANTAGQSNADDASQNGTHKDRPRRPHCN
jgi:hypothetical protein